MDDFFRAHRAASFTIPTFFIESTAPTNVDDYSPSQSVTPDGMTPINSDDAIKDIATILAAEPDPNLVVMVHGFNNPEDAVFRTYVAASEAIQRDSIIQHRRGLVCVGYRWPSERMGQPYKGTWDALPTLPTWILYLGALVVLATFPLVYWARDFRDWQYLSWLWNGTTAHVLIMLGWTIAGLVLAAALLRTIVYFRDNYRAANYGVPDLIQIIRAIDGQIKIIDGGKERQRANRVQLSFIGHSMGGFVVTNAIRTLSDLFTTTVSHIDDDYNPQKGEKPSPEIGHAFKLMRFVLVSPDIPAEALLSTRGNFLASALRRFDEAYLFSNEGDAVLRQISTLANYFVFPTKSCDYGFRLGNIEVLSSDCGFLTVPEKEFLSRLRIGNLTLQELYDALQEARAKRRGASPSSIPADTPLPRIFTYFDCTDYRDTGLDGEVRPLLTRGLLKKETDYTAKLRWYQHLRLLFAYLIFQRPNVHGGYFEGELSTQLIYRLACLGYQETMQAFGGEKAVSNMCAEKSIRVLVSPQLMSQGKASAPPAAAQPAPR